MSFNSILQEYNGSVRTFGERHGYETQQLVKGGESGMTQLDFKSMEEKRLLSPILLMLSLAKKIEVRFLNLLYTSIDAKNAIEILECFIIKDITKSASARQMKVFATLEDAYLACDENEGKKKIILFSKIENCIRRVRKIISGASSQDMEVFEESINKAMEVLKGYQKNLR